MKKSISLLLLLCFYPYSVHCQTIKDKGEAFTQIYTDFHYSLNDTSCTTGFGLNRAYFGYTFTPDDNFSATIIMNIGSPEELSLGSKNRRYGYFREASISWAKDKLSVSFGITGTHAYSFQQKFWEKRYIANSYQSLNGYGTNADLGIAMEYKLNDVFNLDFTLMNGEGYSEIQFDNVVKSSAGLTITPNKQLALRFYGDLTRPEGLWQYTLTGFAGFKNEQLSIGTEINYKSNLDLISNHNAWGISTTGSINISERKEFFVRYDYSTSVTIEGELTAWNFLNDGKFIIVGIQHKINDNIRIALNYQGIYPENPDKQITDLIFLNAFFKF